MVVFIVECVSPSIRGELSRWLVSPKTGVYLGHLSARVRDLLWTKMATTAKKGAGILIYPSNNEQGYVIKTFGLTSKMIQDFEGLSLPKTRFLG
jgi:CRISPR-associated protein Cas2